MTSDKLEELLRNAVCPSPKPAVSVVELVDGLLNVALREGRVEGLVTQEDGERHVEFRWNGETHPISPRYWGAICARLAVIIKEEASLPFNHHKGSASIARPVDGILRELLIEFSRLESPFIRITRSDLRD